MAFVLLPHWSTASHLREITLVPPQELLTTSLKLSVAVPQPSWASAIPVLLVVVTAGHSNVRFGGRIREGDIESRTVIVCTALVALPQPSTAVQVRAMTLVFAQLLVTTSL